MKTELCTSRQQEVLFLANKKHKAQTVVSFDFTTGRPIQKVEVEPAEAAVESRLELDHVLTRISTVFELTRIMKFEHRESWVTSA